MGQTDHGTGLVATQKCGAASVRGEAKHKNMDLSIELIR